MRKLKKNQIKEEAKQVSEALLRFVNPKGFLKKVVMIASVFLFMNVTSITTGGSTDELSAKVGSIMSEEDIYVESVKTKMKSQLVKEVDTYIKRIAPNSQLTPGYLVTKCLEYNTDIIFVLSQALLESHFGTKGKAAETNSVWNVGTYDNGKVLYTYKHPDESLEPYLKLVNEKYLIHVTSEGDTIYKDLHHLIEDRGYTNYRGARFASARGYENGMRKLMLKIDMETSISFYQDIINLPNQQLLSFFNPDPTMNYEDFYALK